MAAIRSMVSLFALLLCVAVASAEINNFIFVHGPWQNGTAFAGTVQALFKNNTLSRAVNLPGNSPTATSAQRAAITFDQYVAYIDQVMLAQQRRPILVCHSSSGELCQVIVGRHATRLIGVVFLSASLGYPGSSAASLGSSSFQASVSAAASRPDNSLPLDPNYVSTVLLPNDSPAQRSQFEAITFPQPLPLFTYKLSFQDSVNFNDSTTSFPHYVVVPSSDTSANYAAIAQTAYGSQPYTQLSVAGGHEFFYFSPATLSSLLIQIQNEILYPNSAPLAAVANLFLVVVCALVALVVA